MNLTGGRCQIIDQALNETVNMLQVGFTIRSISQVYSCYHSYKCLLFGGIHHKTPEAFKLFTDVARTAIGARRLRRKDLYIILFLFE